MLGARVPYRRLLEIQAVTNAYELVRRHGRGLGGAPLMKLKDRLSKGVITEAQYEALRAFMDEGWV